MNTTFPALLFLCSPHCHGGAAGQQVTLCNLLADLCGELVKPWWCSQLRVCFDALPTRCDARATSCAVPALAAVGSVALLRTRHADGQETHAPSQGLWPRKLPGSRFGVVTWHAGCQRVAVAQRLLGGREQLGRRSRSSFRHLHSPQGLSSPALCQAFQTVS